MKSMPGCLLSTAAMSTALAMAYAVPAPSAADPAQSEDRASSQALLSSAEPSMESLERAMASAAILVWAWSKNPATGTSTSVSPISSVLIFDAAT